MTRAEFRALAKEYAEYDGKAFPANDTAWDTALANAIEAFSAWTLCLYSPGSDITTSGTGSATAWLYGAEPVYDLLDPNFFNADLVDGYRPRLFLPTSVAVVGRALRDMAGNVGPVTDASMRSLRAAVESRVAETKIRHWSFDGRRLTIFPTPLTTLNDTGGIKTGTIAGYYLHPRLTSDAHELHLPVDLQPAAAAWCARNVIEAWSGSSVLERLERVIAGHAESLASCVARAGVERARWGARFGVQLAQGGAR
jgi:hypothetical protein